MENGSVPAENGGKKRTGLVVIIIIIVFLAFKTLFSGVDTEEFESVEEDNLTPSEDTYTLMVYMCGSDLESDDGYATEDLAEMINSKIDDKINVIVETGGAKSWQKYGIANSRNQIYQVKNGELNILENNFNTKYMTDVSNLKSFIKYGEEKFPADHYSLVLWDHGGGAISRILL